MLLQLGAFLDYRAILTWIYRRRGYKQQATEYHPTASSITSSNDTNNALNKEIDKLEARLETFRRRAQIVQVRGFHFGKLDERLPHEESSALLGSDSEASSLQRSSLASDASYRTSLSSLHASDEATLAEAPAARGSSHVDRLWCLAKEISHRLWSKQLPEEQYLEPCCMLVSIVEPLKPALRSLDVPCPSSIASYKQTSYFPETDTFYFPLMAGGPFEVTAAGAENGRWIEVGPKTFWRFRESALNELRETGKLHWRKLDRWGKTWQEGWWRGEERPVWDLGTKKWNDEIVRC